MESRIADGTVTGVEWLTLSEAICHDDGILLPPSVLRDWTSILVNQAMRSVGAAYTTRIQALSLLIGDRQTRLIAFEEVRHAIGQPGAQPVDDVLAVLGDTTDHTVLRWLIHHLTEFSGVHQWGVAKALLTPVTRGTLPADLVPLLADAILVAARDGSERGLPAFWLAQRISRELMHQVVTAIGHYPAPVEVGARIQSPAQLRTYLDSARRESGLHDAMLERLLREALSPDFIERRHHALLLLASSPYRQVLAETALDVLDDGCVSAAAADAAVTALTYLVGPAQRDRLVETLDDVAAELKGRVLVALGRSGGAPPEIDLMHRTLDPQQAASAVYAAGMSNHPDLHEMATRPGLVDTSIQSSAIWWCHTGPAIADRPVMATAG